MSEQSLSDTDKRYEAPTLRVLGSIAALTHTGGNGQVEGTNPGAKKLTSLA